MVAAILKPERGSHQSHFHFNMGASLRKAKTDLNHLFLSTMEPRYNAVFGVQAMIHRTAI